MKNQKSVGIYSGVIMAAVGMAPLTATADLVCAASGGQKLIVQTQSGGTVQALYDPAPLQHKTFLAGTSIVESSLFRTVETFVLKSADGEAFNLKVVTSESSCGRAGCRGTGLARITGLLNFADQELDLDCEATFLKPR